MKNESSVLVSESDILLFSQITVLLGIRYPGDED